MIKKYIFVLLILTACSGNTNKYLGNEYLGAKYIADPLGEEMAPDTDPLVRYDAFDCVTFVETALAHGDLDTLTKIRYKGGKIGFLNRNHFMASDWIPNNADIVNNVSSEYAKTKTHIVIIDKANWLKKQHNIDHSAAPTVTKIEYIPYYDNMKIDVERETIVLFIADNSKKRDIIGTDLAVVHTGILLPNGMLRHASSVLGRVVDVNFAEYAAKRMSDPNNLGITLLEIK